MELHVPNYSNLETSLKSSNDKEDKHSTQDILTGDLLVDDIYNTLGSICTVHPSSERTIQNLFASGYSIDNITVFLTVVEDVAPK
eukprot:5142605-Ditylum_brightwellii.AAC.1